MTTPFALTIALSASLAACVGSVASADDEPLGTEGFVDSDGVKIHFVTQGEGPLVVMMHGFPDFWYTWRNQMPALAEHFQVVAIDMRGFNKSDQPDGIENYKVEKLVGDLESVIRHFGQKKANVVGHDWGGFVAWNFSAHHSQMVDRLVILNLPHPNGLLRELKNNPAQQAASQYARNFQKQEAAAAISPKMLAFWVKDRDARKKYIEALSRSSMEGMLNYYKANFPTEPINKNEWQLPNVKCPVLMFHGLADTALLPDALNGTWKWVDNELTLITVPGAGHFIQHDAADLVTRRMVQWLSE